MFRRIGQRTARLLTPLRTASTKTLSPQLHEALDKFDPELFDIIEREKRRQRESIVLIASENYTSRAVLQCLGSVMQNKYSEGYPGARYYGGNEFIDMAELLCQKRALEAFKLDPNEWGVNVQPLSGSPANFAVYTAVLGPHGRMMSLDLPHGGHLSHGYRLPKKAISAVSTYFECLPYHLDPETERIDYNEIERNAKIYYPKLIVGGASAYSRHIDYARLRQIADGQDALLMSDMAHISGLVAAGVVPSPFPHCDIVTTTTHKSLRGPRAAMIFFRKGVRSVDKTGKATLWDLEEKINASVFPGHQGGPHNHTISALAVALKMANSPEFIQYQEQVLRNSKHLAACLEAKHYKLVAGGTDNHLLLADVRPKGVVGSMVERVLELANIATNKNTVPGDKSALNPGGVRLGTPAVTTRGMVETDITQVADFIDRGVAIALKISDSAAKKTVPAFREALAAQSWPELDALKDEVVDFSRQFPVLDFEVDTIGDWPARDVYPLDE